MVRTLLLALLFASLAAPATAVPAPRVWETLPAAADAPLPFQYAGELGATGLVVASASTSLKVAQIVPGSVADMAGLPFLDRYTLCLAAIDGIPIKRLSLSALRDRFAAAHEAVYVTFTKSRDGGPEVYCGPFRLPLSPRAIAERRAMYFADAGRFDEAEQAAAGHPAAIASLAPRLVLAAQEAAIADDYPRAIKLAQEVPDGLTLETRAEHLASGWADQRSEAALTEANQLAYAGHNREALTELLSAPMGGRYRALAEARERELNEALAFGSHGTREVPEQPIAPSHPTVHVAAHSAPPVAHAPESHAVPHIAVRHHIAVQRASLRRSKR